MVLDEPIGQYVVSGHDCSVGTDGCSDGVGGIEAIGHRDTEYRPSCLLVPRKTMCSNEKAFLHFQTLERVP